MKYVACDNTLILGLNFRHALLYFISSNALNFLNYCTMVSVLTEQSRINYLVSR